VDGERYELYFGSLKVGVVTQKDSDFPSLWGTVAYEPWLSSPRSREEERLVRFFALSRESVRLLDMEHDVGTSPEREAVEAEIEARYMDFVESAEWRLVDPAGRELPILCPVPGEDDLVWRWDFDRGNIFGVRQADADAK